MIKVGIVGGTGYTGVELLRLLARHPQARVTAITSRSEAGMPVAQMFPSLRGIKTLGDNGNLAFSVPSHEILSQCDVVFFATPHGVAMDMGPKLVAAGVKIIDLAADFRMRDVAQFEKWYKMPHTAQDLLAASVYGLPEVNRAAIKSAKVIGLPGCYPTSVQLGLKPLLEGAHVDPMHLVADCKSGVSGAGRKAEVGNLLAEASDNFKAYGLAGHRHHPEIVERLKLMAAKGGDTDVNLIFTPHLVPMIRGIFSTLYARIKPASMNVDFQALYEQAYAGEPFVDVMPAGSGPETRSVRGANTLRIAIHRPQADTLMVLVVEDNLVKGASGQGVQCMNLMFGFAEEAGLEQVPLLP